MTKEQWKSAPHEPDAKSPEKKFWVQGKMHLNKLKPTEVWEIFNKAHGK